MPDTKTTADPGTQTMAPKTVGRGNYIVRDGECLSSISDRSGHFWETIWNDSANEELKRKREDPNVLLPGDRVTIPPLRLKEESKPAEQRHRFRRRGVPAKLRLQLMDNGEPRANQDYLLDVDGRLFKGKTDEQGRIEEYIPCGASKATLTVGPEGNRLEYTLDLGTLEPVATLKGVQQRLFNLGYLVGPMDGEWNGETMLAIADFQADNDLKSSGDLDDPTRQKIADVHGY